MIDLWCKWKVLNLCICLMTTSWSQWMKYVTVLHSSACMGKTNACTNLIGHNYFYNNTALMNSERGWTFQTLKMADLCILRLWWWSSSPTLKKHFLLWPQDCQLSNVLNSGRNISKAVSQLRGGYRRLMIVEKVAQDISDRLINDFCKNSVDKFNSIFKKLKITLESKVGNMIVKSSFILLNCLK